jgi:uncharacterized protein GlcG (DUF336 family)
MASLGLAQAETVIDAAIAAARSHDFAPLAVAVLDAGGHLIAFKREDGAGIVRFDVAYGKAWGALGMGFGTRELTQRVAAFPGFVNSLGPVSKGRMVPSPGGVLIAGSDGVVVGAIGISGDKGDNDEICAIAGVEAIGLVPIPGLPGE